MFCDKRYDDPVRVLAPRTFAHTILRVGNDMKTLRCSAVTLMAIFTVAARLPALDATNVPPAHVFYNLDCTEFFVGTFGPVVPGTIDKFVDAHAAAGITHLLINVNAQRTNYRSAVWDAGWYGYDPNRGADQPFFAGIEPNRRFGPEAADGQMYVNMYTFHKQGFDYPKLMIQRARANRVSPWISLRMNDAHAPEQPDHPHHSTFWRSHPQWRLSSGPNPAVGSWGTTGLDYEQPEVRRHYMNLIEEVCDRYDLDGLELDFLRFEFYFRPGRECEAAKLMMGFLQQARGVVQDAARRWKHPVKLAVRVPSTPWIARKQGVDAVAWAKAGLVDMIVASSFWTSANSDIPIETWKGLLQGTNVTVALGLEDGLDSGASGRRVISPEEYRGMLLSGFHRGADAAYFFNLFLAPYQSWPRAVYDQLLQDARSREALAKLARRHPVALVSPWASGEPGPDRVLPYCGKHGVFRIHTGPKPLPSHRTRVELTSPDCNDPLEVRLNGAPCSLVSGQHRTYDVPPEVMCDGYNLVEVTARQNVRITWVEISISE
jgi:hypothetical protein